MFETLRDKLKKFKEDVAGKLGAESTPGAGPPSASPPSAPPPKPRPVVRPPAQPPPTTEKARSAPPAPGAPASGAPPPTRGPPTAARPDEQKKVVKKVVREAETKEDVEAHLTDSFLGKRITDAKIDDAIGDLELALMECDIAVETIEVLKGKLKEELAGRKVRFGADLGEALEEALKASFRKVLSKKVDFDRYMRTVTEQRKKAAGGPVVLMFVGINGTGKTTVIAKLGYRLQQQGYTTVLAAGDTFRAGAIEQLTRHSEKLGTRIISHKAGGDPAAVAFDAIEHAKARHRDVVLVDTAGRMQTNTNLMDEMKKIKRIAQPDKIIFVGDSLAGNDAVEQAKAFDAAVGIDWVILTKIDADSKGGAALSIAQVIGKPVVFVGIGQEYGDLLPFDVDWMLDRLFGKNPPGGSTA